MTALVPQEPGIPLPRPSRASAPYWEGCRQGELRYQRCRACGHVPLRPTSICPRCRHRVLTWEHSAGHAALYSWTVVWRPQHPAFRVPYAPAIVELAEGPRVVTAVVGCDHSDLADGMALDVEFHAAGGDITLPYFHPTA